MKFTQLIFVLILFSFHAFASDTIIVHKDARLDILSSKQSSVNEFTSHMTSNGMYKGYRIQILVTQSRDEAFKMKANLLQNFPNQKAYVIYQSPHFKVRIGNFLTMADAQKFKASISSQYPSGIYVIEDAVEFITQSQDTQTGNE